MLHRRCARPSGSALILVLWCLLILGMAVFGVVEMVSLSVDHASHNQSTVQARALAMSGLALGLHPQIQKDDPILVQEPVPGEKFTVRIQSEGSRLNLNTILLSGHRDVLVNLFMDWGLKADQADHVADCLFDWISPGDLRSLNGAKAKQYEEAGLPQRPTHQPFTSLTEVAQVMGMSLVKEVRADWQDSFTLWSSGPLDINEAPGELIAALVDFQPSRLNSFVEARNGKDGIAGTADDLPVKDIKSFQSQLGISEETMGAIGGLVSLSDPTRRVESVGQANGTRVMISAVERSRTVPIHYLLWSEQ